MPIWEKIAEAYSLNFMRIGARYRLKSGIDEALKTKVPLLVEVVCQYTQGLMPFVSSVKDENGQMKSNPLHIMSPMLIPEKNIVELN